MSSADEQLWAIEVQGALQRYSVELLRTVATRLIKPRNQLQDDELLERILETLRNPPILDRRIRESTEAARLVLILMCRSRRYRWKLGHLVLLLASLGQVEGYAPVVQLLELGLLFPETSQPLTDFTSWIGSAGQLQAVVFTHPEVASRVRDEPISLPTLPSEAYGESPRQADGWDWLLRLAVVWQQVRATPVRLTQSLALFKRDLARLQGDPLLGAASPQELMSVKDPGVLALFWALESGLFQLHESELRPAAIAAKWDAELPKVQRELFIGLLGVEFWEPLRGYYLPPEGSVSAFPSVILLSLMLLAPVPPTDWVNPVDLAEWLFTHHPAWAGQLSKDEQKLRGQTWVTQWLLGVAYPLGLVEVLPTDGGRVRLSDLGRFLFASGPEPAGPEPFPQTLLVQPNAEMLAYRQGLTPLLIAQLSRFAQWKILGPACTLELNAEQTYQGLETGLPLAGMMQTLTRHSMKPVPAAVADLLQRWANKRDRISVYASATLVEFQTAADLETAIARGIISIKVTDRIGLTADGTDPDFKNLRSIGNRDYETKSQRCLSVASDGVTLTVDTSQSDLLLEAELARLAEPITTDPPGLRRYLLTPQSLLRSQASGWGLAELDQWFQNRSGSGLPAAARLFLSGSSQHPWQTARHLVLHLPNSELTDGLMQWPTTGKLVAERLGPTAVVLLEENWEPLQAVLKSLGITVQPRSVP